MNHSGKQLTRSSQRWLGGVCGGIADYFDIDRELVRLSWVLLTFFTLSFPGIILYIILWILMPKSQEP